MEDFKDEADGVNSGSHVAIFISKREHSIKSFPFSGQLVVRSLFCARGAWLDEYLVVCLWMCCVTFGSSYTLESVLDLPFHI
jgi:hypothetical protein